MRKTVDECAPATPRMLSEGEVRMAARRVSALARMNPGTRFCPACLAIDLRVPLTGIVAALHRLLGPNGIRLTSHAACARCGARTPVVYFTDTGAIG